MKALIIGSNGFLAEKLKKKLENENIEFFGFTSSKKKLPKDILIDDINNLELLEKEMLKINPDYLFFLSGKSAIENDNESKLINFSYFKNVVDILINNKKSNINIVVVGSSAEYGIVKEDELPITEKLNGSPISKYGINKLKQTHYSLKVKDNFKNLVIVRPFNILGYKAPKSLPLGKYFFELEQLCFKRSNKKVDITGLNFFRDYIDVDDCAQLIWKLANCKEAHGQIINLCTGNMYNLQELIIKTAIKLKLQDQIIVRNNSNISNMKFHRGSPEKLFKMVGDYALKPIDHSLDEIYHSIRNEKKRN